MKRCALIVGISLLAGLLGLNLGCDALNLGAIAGFFAPGLTIEITNDTDFTAAPDLRTSDATNLAADTIAEQQPVSGVGSIAPRQKATIQLPVNGDLERLYFFGAKFTAGGSFPVGDVNDQTRLRRDIDFTGGDTVRIRLSGAIFSFQSAVEVDHGAQSGAGGSSSDGGSGKGSGQDGDIGDLLDSLFG